MGEESTALCQRSLIIEAVLGSMSPMTLSDAR